jgi:hypothetical protein
MWRNMVFYTLPQDCTILICFHLSKSIKMPRILTFSSSSQGEVEQICWQPTVARSARPAFISHMSVGKKNAAGETLELDEYCFILLPFNQ